MPAVSRPLLIALALAVVALVGFYATQGSRTAVDEPPVADSSAPAGQAPAAVAKVDEAAAPARQPRTGEPPSRAEAQARAKAKAQPQPRAKAPAKAVAGPALVRRALADRRRVVLFFEAPRGADDRATARAVAAQRGTRGVVVVTEPIARLVRYRGLIGGLGISQAPAVVVVGRSGAARLVEGYVDPATLAQEVADAR